MDDIASTIDKLSLLLKSSGSEASSSLRSDHLQIKQQSIEFDVKSELLKRTLRYDYFPDRMLGEPAWDMLLDLYSADCSGSDISVTSLCIASHMPTTTALRWVKFMEDEGWVNRRADPKDGRRFFVSLAKPARSKIEAYFLVSNQLTKLKTMSPPVGN